MEPNIQHFHSIFSLLYKFSPYLASVKSLTRCNSRSRLGINLGRSPSHASLSYLVLSPFTGISFLRFNSSFNNYFETDQINANATTNVSNWKSLDSFRKFGRPSCDFPDTLLQNLPGRDRYQSQAINKHSTIRYAS